MQTCILKSQKWSQNDLQRNLAITVLYTVGAGQFMSLNPPVFKFGISVTRLGNLLDFGQFFNAFGNN